MRLPGVQRALARACAILARLRMWLSGWSRPGCVDERVVQGASRCICSRRPADVGAGHSDWLRLRGAGLVRRPVGGRLLHLHQRRVAPELLRGRGGDHHVPPGPPHVPARATWLRSPRSTSSTRCCPPAPPVPPDPSHLTPLCHCDPHTSALSSLCPVSIRLLISCRCWRSHHRMTVMLHCSVLEHLFAQSDGCLAV